MPFLVVVVFFFFSCSGRWNESKWIAKSNSEVMNFCKHFWQHAFFCDINFLKWSHSSVCIWESQQTIYSDRAVKIVWEYGHLFSVSNKYHFPQIKKQTEAAFSFAEILKFIQNLNDLNLASNIKEKIEYKSYNIFSHEYKLESTLINAKQNRDLNHADEILASDSLKYFKPSTWFYSSENRRFSSLFFFRFVFRFLYYFHL